MTIRPDPELERIRELLLVLAGYDEPVVAAAIDEVMSEYGEVVLDKLVEKIAEQVAEPQRSRIRKAQEMLTAA